MHKLTRKALAVTVGTIVLLSGAGVAFAYWTNSGSGTGSATSAAGLAALTTTQNGAVTGMAPGAAAQDINFTINNPAGSPQYVTNVVMSVTGATYVIAAGAGTGNTWLNHAAGASATGCTSADFTLTQPVAGIDVPTAGLAFTQATNPIKGGRIAMTNSASNQDDCKGTTIALNFAIS